MNNTSEGINSRIADAEKQISDMEDRVVKITQSKKKRESEKCGGYNRHLGQHQVTNICIIGVPEEEREKGQKKLCEEIMVEIFPNLVMKTDIQVQEAQT